MSEKYILMPNLTLFCKIAKTFCNTRKKMKNENWKNKKVSNSEKWKLNISRSVLLYMKT